MAGVDGSAIVSDLESPPASPGSKSRTIVLLLAILEAEIDEWG